MKTEAVPFIDLKRYEPGFVENLMTTVHRLITHTEFIGGPEIGACEAELSAAVGHKFTVGCANGTDAMQLALRAIDIAPADKVLIPDMTFWATYEAVVNAGARPVTVDVDPKSLHLSHALFMEGVEKFRPKAAILVHLYGWAAPDTERIRASAREHKVTLIEDCAQAFGTLQAKRSVIGGAELATTSFYPAKVLGASGDAGAVFTSDESVAQKVIKLGNHGRKTHYSYDRVGWNSRIGAYECAFLRASLKHLPARIESRRKVCDIYRREITRLPFELQAPAHDVFENGYTATGLIEPKWRPKLEQKLTEAGIGTRVIYPGAMSEQAGALGTLAGSVSYGHSAKIALSVLSIPCFAYMRESEIERVIECVRAACRSL